LEAIVIEKSVPAPPATRELRGLALFRDHGAEIIHEGHGVYAVPGCSGGSYTVDLAVFGGEESCSCPDHARHPKYSCKHLIAATISRAKSRAKARREQRKRTASRAARGNVASLTVGA
jgi:hypothetical protein